MTVTKMGFLVKWVYKPKIYKLVNNE